MKNILNSLRKDTVLVVAFVLAVISSFFVLPDKEYIGYIDFRTLSLLFCLMGVMAGLQKIGVFGAIAGRLLSKVQNVTMLILILVGLCFFFSMFITNDVALITFVPFTFMVLNLLGQEKKDALLVPVVIFQTIAANLGSMFTPIGNPQNLYLYGKSGMGIGTFLGIMGPYTGISFVLLLVVSLLLGKKHKTTLDVTLDKQANGMKKLELGIYLGLFFLALLTVVRVMPYYITLLATIVLFLVIDRGLLRKIDYNLLLTFICFFIFIGNMGRLPAFSSLLNRVVEGNEVYCGVIFSQAISNVPAALLLSGFSTSISQILIGVNLGGLGTLIASMASLISYKFVVKEMPEKRGTYFRQFTIWNILFLVILLVAFLILR